MNKNYTDINHQCPWCGSKLPYSLKEQIKGNNCGCGFPPRGYKKKSDNKKWWESLKTNFLK